MADSGAVKETKSSKKNRKKHAKKAESNLQQKTGQTVINDEHTTSSSLSSHDRGAPHHIDPMAELKRQIDEAKAAKDHKKAQELRQQLWVLQDKLHLGSTGPGAPKQDGDLLKSLMPVQPTPTLSSVLPSSSMTANSLPSVSTDPGGKSLKKLKKKLAAIEELKKRQAAGETLEENQLVKIATEDEVLHELRMLEDVIATT